MIYRPFITISHIEKGTTSGSEMDADYPALAICTSAARECVRIMEWHGNDVLWDMPTVVTVCHVCAAVLLAAIWSSQRKTSTEDKNDHEPYAVDTLRADLNIVMDVLEQLENRIENATVFL